MADYDEPPMRWNTGLMKFEPDLTGGADKGDDSIGWFWLLTAIFAAFMLLFIWLALAS